MTIVALQTFMPCLKSMVTGWNLAVRTNKKPAKEGTVEAWGRSEKNPVGGWYGLKKGLRGRFGMYIPPLMEKLGLAELTKIF